MKKFILVILVLSVMCTLVACGEEDVVVPTTTQTTSVSTTVYVLYDESTVQSLLSYYDTGLTESVYDYTFKITPTTYMEKDGVIAEAFLGDSKTAEGKFIIVNSMCFVYDKKQDKYLYLTVNGAVDITPSTEDGSSNTTTTSVDDQNTSVLASRYKKYDLSVVNLTKAITEYDFQVTGISATASNGVKVYKVYVLDEGVYADAVFGIGTDGKDYYYDSAKDEFLVLS